MSMLRLQNRTPSEYCKQSRDFQYLCRLYDCVYNGLLYDISTIPDILSSRQCRDTILPLLQTKLGFFTNVKINNSALRYILEVFPLLLKNKGSATSIRYAVNTFLKINNIKSTINVVYTEKEITLESGVIIPDHTVLIGINSTLQDTFILEEIFKYILPAGIGFYFYYYNNISRTDKEKINDNASIILVSYNINSQIRGTSSMYSSDQANRTIGAVDTINIMSVDSDVPTINGTFLPGDDYLFIGVFEGEDTINDFVQSLLDDDEFYLNELINGNIIIYNNKEYVYIIDNDVGEWVEITFYGNITNKSEILSPEDYTIVYDIENSGYYCYKDSNWVSNDIAIYIFLNYVLGIEE